MSEHLDTQAIAAVRTGEVERFRELVERYERHVYGVAWARLGDATLAEDATQEAFIRAYRLLGWLKDPARFAGWITRITRAVSINLGLRHRRELRRRQRWAIDPVTADANTTPSPTSQGSDETDPRRVPTETLHAALASLPIRHRECLVLFYLEGKTVAEAASALNLSQGAFKVRLHRARHALRGRLQRDLESSLGRLAPRRSLAPGIMSSILLKSAVSDPTGTAGGLLAVLGAGLAKLLPLPLLFFLVPIAAVTVGVGAAGWAARVERGNYRNTEDFRRRLYDDARIQKRNQGAATVLVLVVIMAAATANPDWHEILLAIVAPAVVVSLWFVLRAYRWTGQVSAAAQFFIPIPLFAYFLMTPVIEMPPWILMAVYALYYLGKVLFPPEPRLRFDYNLFLRDRLNLLPSVPEPPPESSPLPRSPSQLWAFTQFGARIGLFTSYRRLTNGIRLRLGPVSASLDDGFWPWPREKDSTLTLFNDGTVVASLGSRDAHHLDRLGIPATTDLSAQRHRVEAAARSAFNAFDAGDRSEALQCLGHAADREIFKVAPARTGFPRFQRIAGFLGLLLIVFAFLPWSLRNPWGNPELRAAHLAVAPYSIDDARAIVGSLGNGSNAYSRRRWDPFRSGMEYGYLLPPAEWASNEGQAFLRTNFVSVSVAEATQNPARILAFLGDRHAPKAMLFAWAPSNALTEWKASAPTLRQGLTTVPAQERARLLEPEVLRIPQRKESELDLGPIRWRIALLKELDCLDLFDSEPLVSLLRDHQVLPGRPLPSGRKQLLDPRPWIGLFRTHGTDPVGETYDVLVILEQLNAVDRIDRTACVEGLLRLHLGKGLFLTPQGWDHPFTRRSRRNAPGDSLYIPGDARTTYAARETLRILGALDRVTDLAEWQYRIHTTYLTSDLAYAHRGPGTWARVEAALLRDASAKP